MSGLRRPSTGRMATVLIVAALLLAVCLSVYVFLVRNVPSGLPGAGGELTRQELRRKLTLLLAVVLGAILLILAFVLGAYLVIRIGRAVAQKPVGGEPTEYVDAWSRYRVSAAQIDAATREEDDSAEPPPPGPNEDESEDEPPPPTGGADTL
jgi:hypothetical protein